MARVHVQSLGILENKYLSQLHKPLVIVIDMVKGFVYEGALHDAYNPFSTVLQSSMPFIFILFKANRLHAFTSCISSI